MKHDNKNYRNHALGRYNNHIGCSNYFLFIGMVGKTFFYNNRPVIVLRDEGQGFVFVVGDLTINTKVEGQNFCFQCNVGGGHNTPVMSHTCDTADEIIEEVLANIEDHEVFWVAKTYLRDEPFEFKPYTQLLDKIEVLKSTESEIKTNIEKISDDHTELVIQLNSKKQELSDLQEKILFTQHELMAEQVAEPHAAPMPSVIQTGKADISLTELADLFASRIKLRALEAGGVDNWEWYGESLSEHGGQDAEDQAMIEIAKLLKS